MKEKIIPTLLKLMDELDTFNAKLKYLGREDLFHSYLDRRKNYKFSKDKIQKALFNLIQRGIINKNTKGQYEFTVLGLKWRDRIKFTNLQIRTPKWDKKWRL